MYSGTVLNRTSGRIMGAHQKIDRVARGHLASLIVDDQLFPKAGKILHFEGVNGPDGIKKKSPGENEPWHFFNPFDEADTVVIDQIMRHYEYLVVELKKQNTEKVAFEAAWLAHAIVDGLTPAHHYPYEEKLSELRGEGMETRNTIKGKVLISGDTKKDKIKNNWKMYGPKGLLSTHGMFEIGVATMIAPLAFSDSLPTHDEINTFREIGIEEYFKRVSREIAVMDIYTRFYKKGWTAKLTVDVRNKLIPEIIKHVTLAWYGAMIEAKVIRNL